MIKFFVGIDVGGTHTKTAILDSKGRIVARSSFYTKQYKRQKLLDAVAYAVRRLLDERNIKKRQIQALGIGVPGLVDFKKGLVFYFVNIPSWENVALKRMLEQRTGITTFVDNDVKVMAVAEMSRGAGRGCRNAVCLTLGTGVGGAIICEGRLYRGSSLVAGEIGHIPINENGPRCNCGGRGCLEAYVGREYFLKNIREEIRIGAKTTLTKAVAMDLSRITPELVTLAAHKKDRFSRLKWQEAGGHIGNALIGVVNLFNPQKVIIGGGMAEAGDVLFDAIRATVKKGGMKVQAKAVQIVKAQLGNDAGVIGAAEMARERLAVSAGGGSASG